MMIIHYARRQHKLKHNTTRQLYISDFARGTVYNRTFKSIYFLNVIDVKKRSNKKLKNVKK